MIIPEMYERYKDVSINVKNKFIWKNTSEELKENIIYDYVNKYRSFI